MGPFLIWGSISAIVHRHFLRNLPDLSGTEVSKARRDRHLLEKEGTYGSLSNWSLLSSRKKDHESPCGIFQFSGSHMKKS